MTERAVLAGGCFWGMQDLIRRLPGVEGTRVGYTGGDVPNATYRNHGTHAEGIEILFDPAQISYRQLLEGIFEQAKEEGVIAGNLDCHFAAQAVIGICNAWGDLIVRDPELDLFDVIQKCTHLLLHGVEASEQRS